MPRLDTLKNKVAVATGASSGIGKAIAFALAELGAEVYLVARRRDELETIAGQIRKRGALAHVCQADLTSDEDIRDAIKQVQGNSGHADVLILCGGAIFHGSLEHASLTDFDMLYRANLRGHYALTQGLLPSLRAQKGDIVFINSSTGLQSPVGTGQFSATQHAFRAIANSLRDEVNADGIRVLSIYLGRVATPRTEALFQKEGKPYRPELLLQPEDVASVVTHSLCLPRTAEVTDITLRCMVKSH
jgi:NADP-dependent 3-hydroxy acid dehydrogenase YdfG